MMNRFKVITVPLAPGIRNFSTGSFPAFHLQVWILKTTTSPYFFQCRDVKVFGTEIGNLQYRKLLVYQEAVYLKTKVYWQTCNYRRLVKLIYSEPSSKPSFRG